MSEETENQIAAYTETGLMVLFDGNGSERAVIDPTAVTYFYADGVQSVTLHMKCGKEISYIPLSAHQAASWWETALGVYRKAQQLPGFPFGKSN